MHSQSAFLWKAICSGHKQNDKSELCLLCFILLCILLLRNRPHWLSCSYSQQDFGFKAKLGTQMKYELLPVRHPCGCAACICHPHSKTKESTAAPTASHMFTNIKGVDNKGTSVMCLSATYLTMCFCTLVAIFLGSMMKCKWWSYLHFFLLCNHLYVFAHMQRHQRRWHEWKFWVTRDEAAWKPCE